MDRRLAPLALCLALVATQAPAQETVIEPGLWEISTRNMQVDGQRLPDMQEMLAGLPAEQRQMMEAMMKERGVHLGNQGMRVCLTAEQVKAGELPMHDAQSGCDQEVTERRGNTWKFRFACPEAEGTGVATFPSKREFTTRVQSTFKAQGMAQSGSMESHGRWIQADCGNVKPMR